LSGRGVAQKSGCRIAGQSLLKEKLAIEVITKHVKVIGFIVKHMTDTLQLCIRGKGFQVRRYVGVNQGNPANDTAYQIVPASQKPFCLFNCLPRLNSHNSFDSCFLGDELQFRD